MHLILWFLGATINSSVFAGTSPLASQAIFWVSVHNLQSNSTNPRRVFSTFDSLLIPFFLRVQLVILISLLMILSLHFNVKLSCINETVHDYCVSGFGASACCGRIVFHLSFSFHSYLPVVQAVPSPLWWPLGWHPIHQPLSPPAHSKICYLSFQRFPQTLLNLLCLL